MQNLTATQEKVLTAIQTIGKCQMMVGEWEYSPLCTDHGLNKRSLTRVITSLEEKGMLDVSSQHVRSHSRLYWFVEISEAGLKALGIPTITAEVPAEEVAEVQQTVHMNTLRAFFKKSMSTSEIEKSFRQDVINQFLSDGYIKEGFIGDYTNTTGKKSGTVSITDYGNDKFMKIDAFYRSVLRKVQNDTLTISNMQKLDHIIKDAIVLLLCKNYVEFDFDNNTVTITQNGLDVLLNPVYVRL